MLRNTSHRDCLGTLLAWPFCFATVETNEWENAQRQQIVHGSYRMHRLMRIITGGRLRFKSKTAATYQFLGALAGIEISGYAPAEP